MLQFPLFSCTASPTIPGTSRNEFNIMLQLQKCISSSASAICRHFSSKPKLPTLTKIPSRYRAQAINQGQQALTDYLHATRSVPFTYAEHIAKNSLVSLSALLSAVDFSAKDFSKSVLKFLRYHPINEFEFFLESIGINHHEVQELLPSNKFFFYEDQNLLQAAFALSAFGFPWDSLGELYREDATIFSLSPQALSSALSSILKLGFSNTSVIAICLAFPCVLTPDSDSAGLIHDLEMLFGVFDLQSSIEPKVDCWYDVCCKVKLFYDLGCERGKLGKLMGLQKNVFVQHPMEVFVEKAEYFCRFSSKKEDVGLLILQNPEILNYDLHGPVISAMGILKHFGLSNEEMSSVAKKHPHALGRNQIGNLPNVMRAMNLHEWLFKRIVDGDHGLLASYAITDSEDLDKDFSNGLDRIRSSRTPNHTTSKLEFLHEIGFGENGRTIGLVAQLHGSSSQLRGRFNFLLKTGLEFSNLCTMITLQPKILNQSLELVEPKVEFLCNYMGASLDYLNVFPAFLCFDLEKRIKPRYRIHKWLMEKGICTKNYSIASLIATSEKGFVSRLYRIHPAAPKLWFECFFRLSSSRSPLSVGQPLALSSCPSTAASQRPACLT